MTSQYLRKISLNVSNESDALELGELRIEFQVKQSDFQTPNYAIITIWNPKDETINKVIKEFTRVVLQAGYENGNFGTIFDGTIKQFRRGKSSPVDKYLTIFAADGDIGLNFSFVNQSIIAGSTPQQRLDELSKSFKDKGLNDGYVGPLIGGVLPRGKVIFGLARDHARRLAQTNEMTFSVQNGKTQFTPVKGFLPGPPIVLTSNTGMIGMPEATNEGIRVRCLLNPEIKIGKLLQIDNKSINQAIDVRVRALSNNQPLPAAVGPQLPIEFFASVTDDGFYRSLVVEHEGDTRENPWYTDIICLAVDRSLAENSVKG